VNDVGESLPSDSTPLVIATIPSVPDAPSKVRSTLDSITISWAPSETDGGSPITNYEIKLDSSQGDGFTVVGYSATTDFTLTGLTSGVEYYF